MYINFKLLFITLTTILLASVSLTIVATAQSNVNDLYGVLSRPTYLDSQNGYTIDEIIHNHELRHRAPSVDFQTINFRTGLATIPINERWKVQPLADVIHNFVRNNPQERFLVEGHTDAVGTLQANLKFVPVTSRFSNCIINLRFPSARICGDFSRIWL